MKFKVYRGDLDPSFRIYSDNIPKYSTSPMHINYYAEIVVCLEGNIIITVVDKERFLIYFTKKVNLFYKKIHKFL